jgi:hypothetical protein
MLSCFMALRTLWFLRQMLLGFFLFIYFKVKRLTLGVTHVESGPLVRNFYHAEQPIARWQLLVHFTLAQNMELQPGSRRHRLKRTRWQ